MSADPQPTEPNHANLDRVREVLARHRAELTSRYHAQGVGIGKRPFSNPEQPEYGIVIYLESRQLLPEEEVTVGGVHVEFVVTGKFTPL